MFGIILDFLKYFILFMANFLVTLPSFIYYSFYKLYLIKTFSFATEVPVQGKHDWVVLVHGLNGSRVASFALLIKAIQKKYPRRPILFISFGRNSDISIFEQAEIIHTKLEEYQNQIGNITMVGMSMGGVVSMIYAKKYPEKISSIITISSPVRGSKICTYNPLYPLVRKELGYHSPCLDGLLVPPQSYQVYHVVPNYDCLIQPTNCAKSPYGISYYYQGLNGHSTIIFDKNVIDTIVDWLE